MARPPLRISRTDAKLELCVAAFSVKCTEEARLSTLPSRPRENKPGLCASAPGKSREAESVTPSPHLLSFGASLDGGLQDGGPWGDSSAGCSSGNSRSSGLGDTRGDNTHLEWKQRTPLCSRVATGISWSSLGNSGCLLCWPREVQSAIRVAKESWGLLSSDCRANRPHLGLCPEANVPLQG